MSEWKRWFAWYPVRTVGGHRRWLCYVDRRWNNDLRPWGYAGYSGTDGGFEYRCRLFR